MPPSVSVLMPVWNGSRYLREAIRSVLTQTFADFELIVVDDGSTDDSADIVRTLEDPRIRLLRLNDNEGIARALNAGLRLARAPLVARHDADDLAEPHRLARQVEVMQAHPHLALLGSAAKTIDAAGRVTGNHPRPVDDVAIRWFALIDNPFVHTSVMFRAALVRDELGGYPEDEYPEDYALWLRVLRAHEVANLSEPLVRYRETPSSIIGTLTTQRASDKRRAYEASYRRLVAASLGSLASADDARVLSGYVLGLDARELTPFLDAFDRLLGAYRAAHPDAMRSEDFRSTVARQFSTLTLRVRPASRWRTTRIFAHAFRAHPEIARELTLSRVAARIVMG